ncbi:MAG: hypothetical protein OXU61_13850 [Gammaproteobacteria bacterium]|nr:hypothetical protein [Gammaproteobacteria bacterium]
MPLPGGAASWRRAIVAGLRGRNGPRAKSAKIRLPLRPSPHTDAVYSIPAGQVKKKGAEGLFAPVFFDDKADAADLARRRWRSFSWRTT